jgi:sulfide:quinone oxidoreductase
VPKITYLTPYFAVTGALQPDDFRKLAALGFKSILSNLPDGESSNYPSAAEEKELARQAGLGFRHHPAVKSEVFSDKVVAGVIQALGELQGPVLAHCASGLRSALVWAAAAARTQPADCVIAALKTAGFDLSAIRGELEEQQGRVNPAGIPPALDLHCAERGEGSA